MFEKKVVRRILRSEEQI